MADAAEYGPIVTLAGLRDAIKKDRFHPRVRLLLHTFVLLTTNDNIDFLCEIINISGEQHEVQGQNSERR